MIKITRIQGHYKIIENNSIIIEKSNLITKNGEEYFLERWINNTNDIINFISVGTGTTPPNKEDINLVNLKSKHTPNKKVDKDNNKIILTTTFTASEINKTTLHNWKKNRPKLYEFIIDSYKDKELLKKNLMYLVEQRKSLENEIMLTAERVL